MSTLTDKFPYTLSTYLIGFSSTGPRGELEFGVDGLLFSRLDLFHL